MLSLRANCKTFQKILQQITAKRRIVTARLPWLADKEVREWLPDYVEALLRVSPQVSTKAVEEGSGRLVGVFVAVIVDPSSKDPVPSRDHFIQPQVHPIKTEVCSMLRELEEGLDAAELLGLKSLSSDDQPKTLDNVLLSVRRDFWSRGIAGRLVAVTEQLARKVDKCHAAKVVTVSEYSYQIFCKAGYEVVREIPYLNYRNKQNVLIFKDKKSALGNNLCARFMIKDLTAK